MKSSPIGNFLNSNQILDGKKKKIYPNAIKYSGTWEKGRKVGEGSLSNGQIKVRVKTKEGQIYKCIGVLKIEYLNYGLITKFKLPSIKVIKVGDYYKEEDSDQIEYFFINHKGQILFDGKPSMFCKEFPIVYDNLILYKGKRTDSKPASPILLDLNVDSLLLIGEAFNYHPNGSNKIYLNDIIFKGSMKGLFYNGKCTAKNQIFKAIIYINTGRLIEPIKITSKVFNFEITLIKCPVYHNLVPGDIGMNINTAYPYMHEILEFNHQVKIGIFSIYKTLRHNELSTLLVSFSLFDIQSWQEVEKRYSNRKFNDKENRLISSKIDEKSLKVYKNNERYEGRKADGKFNGFGKYLYADGSVYAGEFKNNLRHGLGVFKFRDGRVYRGYWVNNLMDGKGYLLDGGLKIYGIWKKNKIFHENTCIISTLIR